MTSYSVLIVSEHPIFRRGIANVIEGEPHLTLRAVVDDRQRAAKAFQKLQPDVALVDLSAGTGDDVEVIERLVTVNPRAKIVNIGGADPKSDVQAALKAGAKGYVDVDAPISELVECILRVAEGGKYLSPSSASRLAQGMWPDALSPRELHILTLLSTGKSNRQIGKSAGICEETVKSHVARVLAKLAVASRTEAVVVAVRNGVIKLA